MAKISTPIFAVALLLSAAASAIPFAAGPLCGASPLFATLETSPQIQPGLPMPIELASPSDCSNHLCRWKRPCLPSRHHELFGTA